MAIDFRRSDELVPPGYLDEMDREVERAANDSIVESRVLPHDLQAEVALIASLVIEGGVSACSHLGRPHFYSESYGWMFEAVVATAVEDRGDVNLALSWLKDHERLAQTGGSEAFTALLDSAGIRASVPKYVEIILEKWRGRQAIYVGQRLAAQGYAGIAPAETIGSALVDLAKLTETPDVDAVLDGAAIAAPLGELDYLVTELGLVAGGGAPHLKAGFGFSGKTVAVQSLALSLASGRPVWGVYQARSRRVLHVDFEQGDRLTRRRYQRLAKAMGVDLATLGDALTVLVMPGISLRIADAPRWKELMTGRDLIIVDSLRAATGGQDENDSSIRDGLDMMGKLSEQTGCRALVIHHARKPSGDEPGDARYAIRGSGAIFDACDAVFVFSASKGEPVTVTNPKARSHGEPIEDFALVVSDVEVNDDPRAGLRVQLHGSELVAERREAREDAAAKVQVAKDAAKVREAIALRPGIGTTELRGVTRLSGDRVAAAILKLGNVDVVPEKVGRSTTQRHYLRGAQ